LNKLNIIHNLIDTNQHNSFYNLELKKIEKEIKRLSKNYLYFTEILLRKI